jgi:hypothetical protein
MSKQSYGEHKSAFTPLDVTMGIDTDLEVVSKPTRTSHKRLDVQIVDDPRELDALTEQFTSICIDRAPHEEKDDLETARAKVTAPRSTSAVVIDDEEVAPEVQMSNLRSILEKAHGVSIYGSGIPLVSPTVTNPGGTSLGMEKEPKDTVRVPTSVRAFPTFTPKAFPVFGNPPAAGRNHTKGNGSGIPLVSPTARIPGGTLLGMDTGPQEAGGALTFTTTPRLSFASLKAPAQGRRNGAHGQAPSLRLPAGSRGFGSHQQPTQHRDIPTFSMLGTGHRSAVPPTAPITANPLYAASRDKKRQQPPSPPATIHSHGDVAMEDDLCKSPVLRRRRLMDTKSNAVPVR